MTQDTTPASPDDIPIDAVPAILWDDVRKLRAFAQAVLEDWPDFSGMDGGEIQDLAVKHGLLRAKDPAPTVPCMESGCACAEYYGLDFNGQFEDPPQCFERTELLTGPSPAPPSQAPAPPPAPEGETK